LAQDAKYKMGIKDIAKLQKNKIEQMFRDHQLERDELETMKKKLSAEIEQLITEHKSTRENVEAQIWDSIDKLKEDQKEVLAKAIDNGMKQKGELTLINNDHNQYKAQKQNLQNEIDELINDLNRMVKQTDAHRQTISSQKSELSEREQTINDKSQRIQNLVQKTQELEKFKFVLDYKIKELKKDIKPSSEKSGALLE
jgi:methyl-accepting chemotaxis protein